MSIYGDTKTIGDNRMVVRYYVVSKKRMIYGVISIYRKKKIDIVHYCMKVLKAIGLRVDPTKALRRVSDGKIFSALDIIPDGSADQFTLVRTHTFFLFFLIGTPCRHAENINRGMAAYSLLYLSFFFSSLFPARTRCRRRTRPRPFAHLNTHTGVTGILSCIYARVSINFVNNPLYRFVCGLIRRVVGLSGFISFSRSLRLSAGSA